MLKLAANDGAFTAEDTVEVRVETLHRFETDSSLAAWWTAGMNTQSSTGLLYVALGCAFAGEVSARVIFFLTGVPI